MTRTKIPIDNRSPFQEKIPSDDAAAAFRPPVTPHPRPHTAPSFNGFHRVPYASARSLSGPSVREICNQMPNPSISAPPPRSYRLRRHFPRHCDVTTRVLHPYKPRFLRYRMQRDLHSPPHNLRVHLFAFRVPPSCKAVPVTGLLLQQPSVHGLAPSKSGLVSGIYPSNELTDKAFNPFPASEPAGLTAF